MSTVSQNNISHAVLSHEFPPGDQKPSPIFRPVTVDDVEELYQIAYDTFEETYTPHNSREDLDKYYAQYLTREVLLEEIRHEHGYFYLIEYPVNALPSDADAEGSQHPTQVVGYIKLNYHTAQNAHFHPDWIEVHRLYVKHSHKGLGIGRAAINFAIEHGRNYPHNKITTLWLIVSGYNHPAREFYAKMGLVEFGDHIFYIGDNGQREIELKMSI